MLNGLQRLIHNLSLYPFLLQLNYSLIRHFPTASANMGCHNNTGNMITALIKTGSEVGFEAGWHVGRPDFFSDRASALLSVQNATASKYLVVCVTLQVVDPRYAAFPTSN